MKKIKSLVALSLALCMVLCFAGCSSNNDEGSLKDNLVNGFPRRLNIGNHRAERHRHYLLFHINGLQGRLQIFLKDRNISVIQ